MLLKPMAEALSPNPRHRISMAARIQSPTSPFFLGSNDDKLERAQARAARAAASRRKAVIRDAQPPTDPDLCLDKDQILELFQNCIKLASENKINQKNTWELNLIDHLRDIIMVEEENDVETNFQKVSCTLEAGVKIYSLRVDSVHSEAYKVLGGINRAGYENERDSVMEDNNAATAQKGNPKKELEKKMSPLSTLESSFEALNVKKIDVAFAVDPLYHQTSAQFDEGGAKGLLLNNLGVYAGCRVLFDSFEVPGREIPCSNQHDVSETIDLSFAEEYLERMVLNMQAKDEISPTLKNIVNQFDEDNRRPLENFSCRQRSAEQADTINNENEFNGVAFESYESDGFDHDDQPSIVNEEFNGVEPSFMSYHEDTEQFSFDNSNADDRFGEVDEYLFLSLGFPLKQNAWAGPDHWKYRKTKGSEDVSNEENAATLKTKKTRNKKQTEPDIDFTKALDNEVPDIFAPPRNLKSLLLPSSRASCNTKLPEDCHYQPEDLVKLFLLPDVMCLGRRRRRKLSDESREQYDDYDPQPSWEEQGAFGGFDDEVDHSDVDDSGMLVSQPRQVSKIEVQYDKTSKQVDVQALKETLWDQIQQSQETSFQSPEETLSLKHLLASFPADCKAAATTKEISPHLCFICLLHLANEHGLCIHGLPNMDDLAIQLHL
ncbi:condensin complex subunit 2-like isoform X2 [Hibiscus syriacus]|uniref:condensin complex subunit 2-like isoform X2 n=1 Tax=Hibiscus syriacus TaxID=106335 RepID=UPI001920FE5E|nr:condensin complex subunit 2-like isoform X2 [Hibiscus syriacus]